MFYVKQFLSALILPPLGPILLACFGFWLARTRPRSGRVVALFALAALGALSLPPVAELLVHSLEDYPPISAEKLARAQAVVILGGGNYAGAPEYGGDTVDRWTLERVRYGVYLQKRSGLPILVTGGAPYGGRPSAETMKETIERDFHGQVKWVEIASRDTTENAAYSAPMLRAAQISRIALVSHSLHLPRAAELFERQGFEVLAAPTGFSTRPPSLFPQVLPSLGSLSGSSRALHEWLGIFVQQFTK